MDYDSVRVLVERHVPCRVRHHLVDRGIDSLFAHVGDCRRAVVRVRVEPCDGESRLCASSYTAGLWV